MAQTLLELTASIVSSHASMSEMTGEELLQEIQKVYASLQKLETAGAEPAETPETKSPAMTLKKAFQPDQVFCMICGKGGMKTLTRHLVKVHGMKPGEYRKQFGIPREQALTAKNFSEARRKMAQDRGLADNLAKAREIRAAK
jgi:predicted transcriptional regulator